MQRTNTSHRYIPLHVVILIAGILFSQILSAEEDREQRLNNIDKEISTLNITLKKFQEQRSKLSANLRQSEIEIANTSKQIRDINNKRTTLELELKQLSTEQTSLEEKISKQKELLIAQIRLAYQHGRQDKLKLLLNQENPEKLARTLAYYDKINEARSEDIEHYRENVNALVNVKKRLEKTQQNLSTNQTKLDKQLALLQQEKEKRQSNLDKINTSIAGNTSKLEKKQKDRQQLEQLLKAVEEAFGDIETIDAEEELFSKRKGNMLWPVRGKISNKFGRKRDDNLRWQGVTISAKAGTAVNAIHGGRIVYSDWLRGSGLLIIIDHGNDYLSLYSQNQSLLFEQGQWVNTGEQIATVGNSGGQQQTGLYFEVRKKGKAIDPSGWCRK